MSVDGGADGDGGHEFPAHYKVMLGKLNEQRRLDQFTDITLIVDGHQFRAHKAVLAACSQFFYKFFQDFTQEPLVEIEGVSNGAFRHLMEFTYTATLAVSGDEEVNDVWRAAEYLQMQEAIKALKSKSKGAVSASAVKSESHSLSPKHEAKKRKISNVEISNVIAEPVPSAETAPLEIQVEVEDEHIEVQECLMEEEVTDGARGETDESALVLLADITSKYQQDASDVKRSVEEVQVAQEEAVMAAKALGGVEVVEVQISENDMFHCDKCDRCFKLFYHLKQHMRTHTSAAEKPFVCKQCGKSYAREGALRQHLVYACHYDPSESRKLKRKVHMCVYCNKEFDHLGHFKEHLRKHTGEKPFECPDCHERFARNSTLKCHMSACQNGAGAKKGRKKLYECQVCGEVFNSWDQFKDHLVIHTGEKPNHCTLCDQWFTHSRELSVHLQQEHPEAVEDGAMAEERVELQVGVMEQQVVLRGGVMVEGHVALQDGVVEQVVMMEGHVELQDGAVLPGGVIMGEGVELQNGMMQERVVLQDGVIVEEGVVISGGDDGETVLIQVEEDGVKEQVTEEAQTVTV